MKVIEHTEEGAVPPVVQ